MEIVIIIPAARSIPNVRKPIYGLSMDSNDGGNSVINSGLPNNGIISFVFLRVKINISTVLLNISKVKTF